MVTALMVAGLIVGGQIAREQPPEVAKTLVPSTSRALLVPPFTFWGNPACDRDGNMYFHVGGFGGLEILRLSADGSKGDTFKVSDKPTGENGPDFGDFSITPSGVIFVLGGIRGKSALIRFDDDGTARDPVLLKLPDGVTGTNIVATDLGSILFFGFYDQTAPTGMQGRAFLAVLDTSGEVRKILDASATEVDVARLASGQGMAPGIGLGDDGNFYFAGPKELLVISQAGQLLQRIPYTNPDPKGTASKVLVSGGVAVIVLTRVDNHQIRKSYLVLLTPSGGFVGYYKPSDQLGGWGEMCFSPKRGFTFLKVENGQVKLQIAPLP
jgi:hypothetical protein